MEESALRRLSPLGGLFVLLLVGACARGGGVGSSGGTPPASGAANPDQSVSDAAGDVDTSSAAVSDSDEGSGVDGLIVDASGKAVAGAFVAAAVLDEHAGPVPDLGVLSDAAGRFHWPLGPGRYRLTVHLDGNPVAMRDVEVPAKGALAVKIETSKP